MTVKEFMEHLRIMNVRGDEKLVILASSGNNIGAASCAEIKAVSRGFDWNSGKVLIQPTQNLTAPSHARK